MNQYLEVISEFRPKNGQQFAIADVNDLRGGYIQVNTMEEMQAFLTTNKLKEGMLPTVQIKHNIYYLSNMWLESSDFYVKKEDKYYRYLTGPNGEKI